MSRLHPCPACGRHVRLGDGRCPFCATSLAITAGPSRLSLALLGLCLTACTSGKDAGTQPASTGQVQEPAPTTSAPAQTSAAPEIAPPEIEGPVEGGEEPADTGKTTSDEPSTGGEVEGTDSGDTAEDPPPIVKDPKPKPKYGAPRPATKYGGAPKPGPVFE